MPPSWRARPRLSQDRPIARQVAEAADGTGRTDCGIRRQIRPAPSSWPYGTDLSCCGRDCYDLAGVIGQLTRQECHVPAPADDPSAPGEPPRPGRPQELHVQVGGRGELSCAKRCPQRRAQGAVQHRRYEPALDNPCRIQELITGRERDLDCSSAGVYRHQLPAEKNCGRRWRRPALHHVPERALACHASLLSSDRRECGLLTATPSCTPEPGDLRGGCTAPMPGNRRHVFGVQYGLSRLWRLRSVNWADMTGT